MSLQFYKPNARTSGTAASFSFKSTGDKKGVFIEMIKQTGWDNSAKKGSFKGGQKVLVKLSMEEVAAFINVLSSNKGLEKDLYHKSSNGVAIIQFNPYFHKLSEEQIGFSLAIKKTESENGESKNLNFLIGLTKSEGTLFKEWLKFSLERIFTGIYSEDKKAAKEYFDQKNNS